MKERPSLSARSHAKFQIQSIFIESEDTMVPHFVWNDGVGGKWKVHSRKLSTVLLEEGENTVPDEISVTEAPSIDSTTPSPQSASSDRDELRHGSQQPSGPGIINADPRPPLSPAPGLTAQGRQDLEQQLINAQEEIKYLRALLARSDDGAGSTTDASDTRARTPTAKSFTSGVELMMEALRNLAYPLASLGLIEGAHD